MGLVGHVLTPIWLGCRSVITDPLRFLQRPLSWLTSVGTERATITSAPNFAYELCCRAAEESDIAGIDLSTLTTVVCGGEVVVKDTVDRFIETFASTSLRRSAFAPSYGLAEATLLVASGKSEDGPRASALRFPSGGEASRRYVSCGRPVAGMKVRIVNPADRNLVENLVSARSRLPGRVSGE